MLKDKNSAKINKNSKILIAVAAILTITYFLSFTKSCSSSDKREKVKTALVNQKYKESINTIILQDSTSYIELKKNGDFWIAENTSSLPASSEKVTNLINELIKIRNLYKISDKINKNSSLGLTNGTEFHIRYSYDDSSFRELIFGNQDFSLSSRYMMTGESTQVYEIDSSMDNYLTTSIQNWAEPYIISQNVLGKISAQDIQRTQVQQLDKNHLGTISDIQKLLDLRHGGIPDDTDLTALKTQPAQTSETEITLELGNKNEIELKIYHSEKENEFIVITCYKPDKNKNPIFTSTAKISSWTYNKIKEITL